jgi:hypothetical protein
LLPNSNRNPVVLYQKKRGREHLAAPSIPSLKTTQQRSKVELQGELNLSAKIAAISAACALQQAHGST